MNTKPVVSAPVLLFKSSLIISRENKTNTGHHRDNCKAPEIRQDFTKLHIYVGIKTRARETRLESNIIFCSEHLILFVRGDRGGQRAIALVPGGQALSQYSKLIAMPNLSSKTMMGSCLQISPVPGAEDK